MINQTTGQYTYGVPQNNGYYSSGYGSIGNPYIGGGPFYTGTMNNTGGGSSTGGLLSNSAKVQSNPGFDDTDGTPIHYSPSGEKSGSYYFNEAQKLIYPNGLTAREYNNLSNEDKGEIRLLGAKMALQSGDKHTAGASLDAYHRVTNNLNDFNFNKSTGKYSPYTDTEGLHINNQEDYFAPIKYTADGRRIDNSHFNFNPGGGAGQTYLPPQSERGLLSNIDQESISNIFDWINPLGILSKADDINIPDLITNFVQSKFNANKQSTPAQVTAPVANAFNPYAGYEAAPAPATANNEDGYGGYANADAHAAAQSVMEEKVSPDEYWYI